MHERTQPEVLDLVRAHRVEIIDTDGRVRAILGDNRPNVHRDGPYVGLSLLDLTGAERVSMLTHARGVDLSFVHGGNDVMILTVDDAHAESISPGVTFTMCAADGSPALSCHVDHEGTPRFRFDTPLGPVNL